VEITIRFADFATVRRQTTLTDPTDDAAAIEAAVRGCVDRVPLVKKVRLVGVRLAGLSHPKPGETPVATARPPPREAAASPAAG
jgi:DNA polymerase IV